MTPHTLSRAACALFFCLLATPVFAQYTIKKIVFDNPGPYTQTALEAAAGLKTGDSLGAETLQQSAQRLVDTGAFEDLQVTLDGPLQSVSVLFKVKPLDPAHQLLATFDNFIWFTPSELEAALHSRVPLYAPILPESGNLQDAVETALAALLKEKGVTATLTHQLYEPSAERPARVVAYRVKSPSIVLHGLRLAGVSPEFATAVHDAAGKITGRPYTEGIERATTADALLAPYLTAGFLDARLSGRTLVPTGSTADRIDVDLAATVEPGTPYRIGEVAWAGSPQIGREAFAAADPLHPGDLASPVTLAKAVDLIATAYHKDGYNDALVAPHPIIDKGAGRVSYTFTVTPGEVYHVRSVTPVNLSAAQQADYARGWRLKPGDVYNPVYIATFLKQNTALRSFESCSASFKAISEPETRLVDVTVTFVCGRPLTTR